MNTIEKQNIDNMWFVPVPEGTFQMGDVLGEGDDDEVPVRTVSVSRFLLSATTVTFDKYDAFCEATGSPKPSDNGWGRGDRPIINVDWSDALAFCSWLSERTGRTIRLPTEMEWEYAARQGGENVRFGNGENVARPTEINFDAREPYAEPYSNPGEYRGKTLPVDSFPPNRLGLHQMSGNVWEWCSTNYTPSYDQRTEVVEVWSPGDKKGLLEGESVIVGEGSAFRRIHASILDVNAVNDASQPLRTELSFSECPVLRGGAFDTYPRNIRATLRGWDNAQTRNSNRGFRVVSELNR
uniref:Formylglycine-generating enzyme, required for sulfatase activity, contains SUMF1/FGE domain n=1 Tax=Candidatus Kentrum sp. DK TaxID=2126562 RepID=A0A450RZJ9_9GAMM|nr:MAG: Formylglycine-generating enzyme, required for sulfatase activity, contains SUMF1/FGE domain [Candidatus Kentron sp. DK]